MGLYSIPVRDHTTASEIPAILERHGYTLRLKSETDHAKCFAVSGKRGELTFSISNDTPPRFLAGIGPECREIARVLAERGVFESPAST